MTSWIGWIMTAAVLGPASPGDAGAAPGVALPACRADAPVREVATDEEPGSPYYAFDLVGTGRVPGTGRAAGTARAVFASSPFGIAVAPDGSYVYDLLLDVEGLGEPPEGTYHVWVTTPSLDRVRHLGRLVPGTPFRGTVGWNKFLVVLTLEPGDAPIAAGSGTGADGAGAATATAGSSTSGPAMWRGPIVLRGMSRSGMMHTMAGHGPFQQENCAAYGYEE